MVTAAPITIKTLFFRDAQEMYGAEGLVPATQHAVGIDLRVWLPAGERIRIPAGGRYQFLTGIAIEPTTPNIAGFVYSRSGLGAKIGLTVAQGVGIIDPDYRGEISIFMLNTSNAEQTVERGDRIAQLVFHAYCTPSFQAVSSLGETLRDAGGFGHTGIK